MRSDCVAAGLAGADADRFVDGGDEDFAVSDASGFGGLLNGFDGGVKVGALYFGLAKNFASRRGYLTDHRTELRTAVAGSGILGPPDLKAFEAECGW